MIISEISRILCFKKLWPKVEFKVTKKSHMIGILFNISERHWP